VSGFVAILNCDGSPCDAAVLRRLTDYLAFRGPDAQQVWAEGPAGLGHALLTTTKEAEHEPQPFSLDRKLWIVADARVDGRKELVDALTRVSSNGPPIPVGTSDAELILRAYLAWGESCLDHLLGDFAFVIWDTLHKRLFAARDHFGVKPLFYSKAGNTLVISNTLDCIRRHPTISDRLDDLAIADFLLFDSIQEPGATAFADVRRLPPAHALTSERGDVSTHRYWELSVNEPVHYRRPSEYIERFLELLDLAVADRLLSEKAGVLMSGGLDSTTVAASAKRILSHNGNPDSLRAYTAVFDLLFPHEEGRYAALVADSLKIQVEFQTSDNARIFQLAETHRPEPVHTPCPHFTACQLTHAFSHSREMLTGFGADPALSSLLSTHFRELLTKKQFGRAVVDAMKYLSAEGRFSRLYIRTRLRRWLPSKTQNAWCPEWLNPDLDRRFDLHGRWEEFTRSPVPRAAVRPVALEALAAPMWANLFETFDPGATRIPVLVRHPFFDLRLVNFLLALPTVPWCCDKELLRAAARGVLPDAVRLRRKSPLQADPLVALLQRPDSAWVDNFRPVAELERYVIRHRLPRVFGTKDTWSAWINLRPLSLNFWLQSQGRLAIE